ncbi:ribosome small subunit-dependent GTPase A [Chryseosolibacter indicus]|uniref:Small ribosomal subunit biogenesis GTPase RsgA n=1 Tax=Chryseosolibacter indicus TaxID=2782351 RepID=A0ABS5VJY7_9BACT|nr:ribosome small subunit-dependent GTPase A [Chryseosolibacter indicus]MBT1701743.1 ribosome small subunit-dependent GTPase A [Chryseosolibacter indicus]
MSSLKKYGWNSFHQEKFNLYHQQDHSIGRVISIKGFKYYLMTENGELETELSGKLLYGSENEDLPKVGDWVYFLDYDKSGYIIDILPRKNSMSRKTPGNKTEKQILAANVDYAFIVQGLDRDYNIMRLERYLTQVVACNITPIVILNKADLVENMRLYEEEVLKLQRNCEIFFCSTLTGLGIDRILNSLKEAKTYILIGSSGVGKSSLINSLTNNEMQKTNATSKANSKGKHTTTTRDLFLLPNGSLLIDTPGMREFGLTSEEGVNTNSLFPALEALSAQCRYSDCRHLNEEACAVKDAVNMGALPLEIYESYVKLLKEQRRFEIRIEDKKRLNKQFGKITREAKDYRKRNKY